MHKYQPRIHIIKKKDSTSGKTDPVNDLEQDTSNAESKTFIFHETEFITVTAYQNQQVGEGVVCACARGGVMCVCVSVDLERKRRVWGMGV